jgi:hypothetical protein
VHPPPPSLGRSRLLSRHPLETYSAYLDGHCLTDAEVAALRAWIVADESNAVQFVEFAVLHAAITERLRLDRLLDDLASHRSATGITTSLLANAIREIELNSPRVLELSPPVIAEAPARTSMWPAAATFAAVAATLLVALWGVLEQGKDLSLPRAPEAPIAAIDPVAEETKPPEIVAQLTTSFDAQWSGNALKRERDLVAGTSVAIASGVAEFTMTGGAAVVIEGPSEFVLAGPNKLTLAYGKAAVRADGGDFIVDTPKLQVIDLGTEFGVEAAKAGSAQVMVFDGSVALADAADATASADVAANAPTLDAGFQVKLDERHAVSDLSQPELLENDRYFLRPDEIDVRRRALAGSAFDRQLAEHYERQRIDGLLAYQPFDAASSGREFSIGIGPQGVALMANVQFVSSAKSGAIDVQNGPVFVSLDSSPSGRMGRAGLLKANGLIGQTGGEIWVTWTSKRLNSAPDSTGSAGLSFMFGEQSDFDEPIFVGRGFGDGEEVCMQSAWGGGTPPNGERIDVELDSDSTLPGPQTSMVDSETRRWLARIEFRDGADRVSVWIDESPMTVDVAQPQAVIDAVDVEFDRVRLAVNRSNETWRFSDFAIATKLTALEQLEKVGAFNID